jgi:hypothetical protein
MASLHPGQLNSPVINSLYHPLSVQDSEIRLLTILPSSDPSATVSCRLWITSFGVKPLYVAISYVWGKSAETRIIRVNNRPVAVNACLERALVAVRNWAKNTVVTWIDGLCINQNDPVEKLHQIKFMSQIYAGASHVLGWLGESADKSDYAIDTIKKMAEGIQVQEKLEGQKSAQPTQSGTPLRHWLDDIPQLTDEDDKESIWNSIGALFKRSFWKRLWIRQEIVLARELILLCGRSVIAWDLVHFVGNHFENAMSTALEDHLTRRIHSMVLAIDWGRHIEIRRWRRNHQKMIEKDDLMPIYMMIPITSGLQATDPRDHIYGLLGISKLPGLPEADYSLSVESLYTQYTELWIAWNMRCSELGWEFQYSPFFRAGIGFERRFAALPSWVVDLSTYQEPSVHIAGLKGARAAGKSLQHMTNASVHCTALRLRGHVVATVTNVWSYEEDTHVISYLSSVTHKLLMMCNAAYGIAQQKMLLTIFRTIMEHFDLSQEAAQPEDAELSGRFASFIAYLQICQGAGIDEVMNDESVLAAIERTQSSSDAGLIDFAPYQARFPIAEAETEDFIVLMEGLFRFLSLFKTSDGSLGMGPRQLKQDDVLCILPGGEAPLVLRPSGQHYTLVGPCYLHGLMNGEAVGDDLAGWVASLQDIELH